jgi:hypothetical protein
VIRIPVEGFRIKGLLLHIVVCSSHVLSPPLPVVQRRALCLSPTRAAEYRWEVTHDSCPIK